MRANAVTVTLARGGTYSSLVLDACCVAFVRLARCGGALRPRGMFWLRREDTAIGAAREEGGEIAALDRLQLGDHCIARGRVGGHHQRQERANKLHADSRTARPPLA